MWGLVFSKGAPRRLLCSGVTIVLPRNQGVFQVNRFCVLECMGSLQRWGVRWGPTRAKPVRSSFQEGTGDEEEKERSEREEEHRLSDVLQNAGETAITMMLREVRAPGEEKDAPDQERPCTEGDPALPRGGETGPPEVATGAFARPGAQSNPGPHRCKNHRYRRAREAGEVA